jgi:hypothetical protein
VAEPEEKLKKKLGEIHRRLGDLRDQEEIIRAKYTKNIWSDEDFDKYAYNQREKLRQAELTLRLSEDKEYKDIHHRIRELEAEQVEMGDEFDPFI